MEERGVFAAGIYLRTTLGETHLHLLQVVPVLLQEELVLLLQLVLDDWPLQEAFEGVEELQPPLDGVQIFKPGRQHAAQPSVQVLDRAPELVEVIVELLVIATVVAVFAKSFRIPYTVSLVLVGTIFFGDTNWLGGTKTLGAVLGAALGAAVGSMLGAGVLTVGARVPSIGTSVGVCEKKKEHCLRQGCLSFGWAVTTKQHPQPKKDCSQHLGKLASTFVAIERDKTS